MSSFGEQLRVLLYKNVLIKKRKRRLTMLEVLFPLYFGVILVIMKLTGGAVINIHYPEVPFYNASSVLPFPIMASTPIKLAYTPDTNPTVNGVVNQMVSDLSPYLSPDQVMGFSTFNDLTAYYHKNESSIWAGLNVQNISANSVQYQIAVNSSSIPASNQFYSLMGYLSFQLSFLQSWWRTTGHNVTLSISTTQFPTPATTHSTNIFAYLMPIYLPLLFMYSLQQLVVLVVTEKERKIREAFKIMGMKAIASYLSFFIVHTVINTVSIVLFIAVMYITKVFEYTNILAVFVPFWLYSWTVTLLGFIVSIFVEKPRVGAAICSLVTLLAGGIWFGIHFFVYDHIDSVGIQFVFSLVSGIAFGEYAYQLSMAEFHKVGIQLSDPLFGHTVLFLLVDIALYTFLVWYFDNIYVGNYGVAKKWYFPFSKSYWASAPVDPEAIRINQPLLSSTDGGVSVNNIFKEYDGGKVKAVNGLSLHVQPGEILALLGHNGAGKSTTINILTGLSPPTSGTINIMGFDYANQMELIRKLVGYCPQHNILLDNLTCAEHLRVFGLLKGVSKYEIDNAINTHLEEVGLMDKKDTFSVELSGGMKRKLSVAIAFIGGSQLIFLDECTAGMDPYSRRKVWQLLQKYKTKKTIIMTTHFMEEAELLGDRIAIMAKGKLRCMGTSMQLKNEFGVGYILRFVKEDERAKMDALDAFVQSAFPACAVLPSPSGLEIIYSIPNDMTNFARFFAELQARQTELGVKSFGLSMTTLEEVFLKIAAEDHEGGTGGVSVGVGVGGVKQYTTL
eukprot:Phypoly_transcript_02766.p1 GENE.Phypoly_transcript_02766~~Phypoly_transcript_02766.p1  ORF type:complete len:787 (+),score=112.61 Phypoly_transcript_02766:280-2640(+)